ncbi:hypothetical protein ACFY9S_32865 [Streptomyces sp. NPDC012474]
MRLRSSVAPEGDRQVGGGALALDDLKKLRSSFAPEDDRKYRQA